MVLTLRKERWEGDYMTARGKKHEANSKKQKSASTRNNNTTKKKSNAAVKKATTEMASIAAGHKKSKRLLEWEEPEKLALIEGWVRNGVIEKDIATNMHCSYSTLREWKKISSALSAALKKNRDIADYIVEGALFKKAIGHKEKVQKPMKIKKTLYDSDTGKRISDIEEIVYVEEEVYIPPDTLADIFWLKNRRPEQWQDKVEQKIDADVEHSGGVLMLAPRLEENK